MRSVVISFALDHPSVAPRSGGLAARDPGIATSAPRGEPIAAASDSGLPLPTECCGSGSHKSGTNGGQPSSSSSPRPSSPGTVEASGSSGLGKTGHPSGRPCIDSPDGGGKSALGCAESPRRTLETRHRRQSSDRGQIHGSRPAPAVPDLADIPRQSRRPDRGRRFLDRAHRHLSTAVRVDHPCPSASQRRARRGHCASDRPLDRPTTPRGLSRRRRPALPHSLSRSRICRLRDHCEWHGHP